MIYSATMNTELTDFWVRQVGFAVAGVLAVFIVAAIDYRQLSLLAVPAFLLFIASLFVVLLFGEAQGGSKSWINVAGTLVQPTEAGKFLVIIFLSWYLSWFQDRMGRLPYLLAILVLLGAPLVLVFIQPDFGMTITYAFLGGALILVAGVRYRHLAMLRRGGGPGAAAAGCIAAGLHAGAPLHLYADRRADRADSAPDPGVPAFQL